MLQDFFHQPYWHHLGSMHFRRTAENRSNQKFIGRVIFSRISPPKITIQSIQTKCQPSGIIKWDPFEGGISNSDAKMVCSNLGALISPEKTCIRYTLCGLVLYFHDPRKQWCMKNLRRKDLYAGVTADVKVRFDGWWVSTVWLMGFAESGR